MIQNKILRALVYILGWTSIILGLIGAFLPLLPTTPFILLSAWCFIKSSPGAHQWLRNHSVLGPPLINWEEHGAISTRAKVISLITIVLSMIMIWYRLDILWLKILVTCILLCSSTFIVTRPKS